jgi:hypothetical protein
MRGHGDKSLYFASQLLTLTQEEADCILCHMGAFMGNEHWKQYIDAIRRSPNVLWMHQADMLASHVLEDDLRSNTVDEWEHDKRFCLAGIMRISDTKLAQLR